MPSLRWNENSIEVFTDRNPLVDVSRRPEVLEDAYRSIGLTLSDPF